MPAIATRDNQILGQLRALGTAQNRKVYGRHGVGGKMYGVSYSNLYKLLRQIEPDHELALRLWNSGIHDARVLACMITEPARVTSRQLDEWARDLDNHMLSDALASLAAKTTHARRKMEQWTKSRDEWIGATGWQLLAGLARDAEDLTNEYLDEFLRVVERDIHRRPNRVRYCMNTSLIAIGTRNKTLERRALAVAKRIGVVKVDHGETNCKTPDAASYIRKAVEWNQKRKGS